MKRLWGLYMPGDWHTFDFIKADNGTYRFKFSIEGGLGLQGRKSTPEQARALANAIYAELGLGWFPYPENRPGDSFIFDVALISDERYIPTVSARYFEDSDDWYSYEMHEYITKIVVAYRVPTPYQPD